MEKPVQVQIAGVMSGTSADGVDVALVRVRCDPMGDHSARIKSIRAELVSHHGHPYDPELRKGILDLRNGEAFTWPQLAATGRRLTLVHAMAVQECLMSAGSSPAEINAIADHGQTFFHDPPNTIQWLDPSLLAAQTGIEVISDFRRADCAVGGQGAPLVPFADYVLFRHPIKSRVLLNIGGIANLTYIPANGSIDQVIAFDTGPGNCISDALVSRTPSGATFDAGGGIAAQGEPIPGLVERLMLHPYFHGRPPKSTDRPEMIRFFDETFRDFSPEATLASKLRAACEVTARSIAESINSFLPSRADEIFVSGGGVENEMILRMLREAVDGMAVRRTDELGVKSQAKEAMAFAILGAATLWGLPSNVPNATGATRAVVLGSVTPRP